MNRDMDDAIIDELREERDWLKVERDEAVDILRQFVFENSAMSARRGSALSLARKLIDSIDAREAKR
jgi:hypothetical protein